MKKKFWLIGLLLIFFTFGCEMGDTPSAKVEELLKKYNNKADIVKGELGDYLDSLNLDEDNRASYQDIYLKQYSDLTYEIKNEAIDGDNATVTTQIKVYDYYIAENTINNYISTHQTEFYDEDNVYSASKALSYRIDELGKVREKIEYTIDFNLTKINDDWVVDTLTNEQLEKIHGTYAH